MAAGKLNLPSIEKGATYRHTLYWKDKSNVAINMTGCTAKLQIRETISSPTVLLELSTTNGYIIITGTIGKIELYIPDEVTTLLVGSGGIYDLEIYWTDGDITRLVEGKWAFKDEVTRG
jgi:hypothetical protein